MLKRYLLFVWLNYNESGGWNDFAGSYDTVEDALRSVEEGVAVTDQGRTGDNWQIVDRDAGRIIVRQSGY